jgi:ApaG protein
MAMSTVQAITHGIHISVLAEFSPEQSRAARGRYFWTYTIEIENRGSNTVQLLNRHWVITDANGHQEEVRGPGVVGQQPVLPPGESFRYSSGCPLPTPFGSMQGEYEMTTRTGARFEVIVPAFALSRPGLVQ